MPPKDYARYSLSDFLEDDYFLRWVREADPETDAFWSLFIQQNPEKAATLKNAAAIVNTYRAQHTFTNIEKKQELWGRINTELHEHRSIRIVPSFFRAAAAITITILAGIGIWYALDDTTTVRTAFNEVTTITLPDHSIVTLNGNSVLKYNDDWNSENIREVWVEGEAYFNVSHINKDTLHIKPSDRFIVHSHSVNIEVLGTSFNVRNVQDETNVTLITGKVKVHFANDGSQKNEGIVLSPGEQVHYASKKLITRKKLQNPQQALAWTRQEFTFSNASLGEIVKKLSEDHGYDIDVKDPALLELKIEGEISVSTVTELLSTLSATLELKIDESGKHIVISKK